MKQSSSSPLKTCGLPAVVFFTGACVLIVEIVATRILSPYFGNTIFTVSSVITVVLAALSLGYFYGGRLADKRPEFSLFFNLVLLSGLSVLLTYVLIIEVLQSHGYDLPIMSGPLVFSMLLFFVPSAVMGTLSPFAIKLQAQLCPDKGTGRVAGEIFFWSTLGSIAGSLLTGFVLIPFFGIKAIVLTTGGALSILGLVLLVASGGYKKKAFSVTVLLAGVLSAFIYPAVHAATPDSLSFTYEGAVVNEKIMYSQDGIYEKVMVMHSPMFRGHPANLLVLDRSYSAEMFLDTDEPAAPYTKYYVLYKLFKPDAKNVLVLGGGGYTIPKLFLGDLPNAHVDVAEIEPSLFDLSKKYFDLDTEDPRLKNYVQDGRRMLHEAGKHYDVIFSDAFNTLYSVPGHMATTEFFELAKTKMTQDGIFISNLVGNLNPAQPSLLLSEIRTFCGVFPNCYLFSTKTPKPGANQNFIAVGVNGAKKLDLNAPEIKTSDNETLRNLGDRVTDLAKLDLPAHQTLTDDYAPVEYMTASMLKTDPDTWQVKR